MSFRYSNQLTAVLKQKLLIAINTTESSKFWTRTFSGCCHGVEVRCNASGSVEKISVVDTDMALSVLFHKCNEDGAGTEEVNTESSKQPKKLNTEMLAMAVKTAAYAAHRSRMNALTEIYREATQNTLLQDTTANGSSIPFLQGGLAGGGISTTLNQGLKEGQHRGDVSRSTMHVADDNIGMIMGPRFWESFKDFPVLTYHRYNVQHMQEHGKCDGSSRQNGIQFRSKLDAAAYKIGELQSKRSLVIRSNPEWAGSLLPLANHNCGMANNSDIIDNAAVYSEFCHETAPAERYFWDRVDLIKKAQTNVIQVAHNKEVDEGTMIDEVVKRPYTVHSATKEAVIMTQGGDDPDGSPGATDGDAAQKFTLKFVD